MWLLMSMCFLKEKSINRTEIDVKIDLRTKGYSPGAFVKAVHKLSILICISRYRKIENESPTATEVRSLYECRSADAGLVLPSIFARFIGYISLLRNKTNG